MPRLLWIYSDHYGCGAYRSGIPSRSLGDRQLHENTLVWAENVVGPLSDELDRVDAVIFQRTIGQQFIETMKECRRRGIAILYDMDDLLFSVPRHSPEAHAVWSRKSVQSMLRWQLAFCDAAFVSTVPLRKEVVRAMGWKNDEKIHVCPNHLHPSAWGERVWADVARPRRSHVTIGWQGSFTHDADFARAREAIARILTEDQTVRLVLFGSLPEQLRKLFEGFAFQATFVPGVPFAHYPQHLRALAIDVGIAPLEDTPFNRCKSNVKWLEYSALGIPCVASRVAPYASSIADGETGFLAVTEAEWYERLSMLVASPELRGRIGSTARAHAWEAWGDQACHTSWVRAIDGAIERAKGKK